MVCGPGPSVIGPQPVDSSASKQYGGLLSVWASSPSTTNSTRMSVAESSGETVASTLYGPAEASPIVRLTLPLGAAAQVLLVQMLPAAQSASLLQLVRHAVRGASHVPCASSTTPVQPRPSRTTPTSARAVRRNRA